MKIKTLAAASIAALLFLSGCTGDTDDTTTATSPTGMVSESPMASASPMMSESPMESEAPMADPGTIVDVAAGNPDFKTLVAAITAADLAETLSGEGPFTVFAPTNEAFEALPAGVLDALLLPANKDALVSILTYHVLPAEVMSADVTAGEAKTVEGSTVKITTDGGVMVNGASVVTPDVDASNGVIHAIDAVLVPASVDVEALLN